MLLGVENRQIQLGRNQVMYSVFKGAGLKLFLEADHDHGALVVVVMLEARHANNFLSVGLIQPNRDRGFGVFLKPKRLR
jgi:hypothetical protein